MAARRRLLLLLLQLHPSREIYGREINSEVNVVARGKTAARERKRAAVHWRGAYGEVSLGIIPLF